jgi:hypothetical protein
VPLGAGWAARRRIRSARSARVRSHVVAVLRELEVPADWIGEIGAAVAPLREPIVTA